MHITTDASCFYQGHTFDLNKLTPLYLEVYPDVKVVCRGITTFVSVLGWMDRLVWFKKCCDNNYKYNITIIIGEECIHK